MQEKTVLTEEQVQGYLDLINSLEVVDDECEGEECVYVTVEANELTRNVLLQLGYDEEYIKSIIFTAGGDMGIDIAPIAWEKGAGWYDPTKGGFLMEKPAYKDEDGESEQQHLRWLELMNEAGIWYHLSADTGIDFKDEAGKEAAYQLAREHGLHLIANTCEECGKDTESDFLCAECHAEAVQAGAAAKG